MKCKNYKRDWLRELYPDGIGLGEVLHEYLYYKNEIIDTTKTKVENKLRLKELSALLNHFYRMSITPVFTHDGDFCI